MSLFGDGLEADYRDGKPLPGGFKLGINPRPHTQRSRKESRPTS